MRELRFRAWDTVQNKYLWPWPEGFALFGEVTCFDLIGQQLSESGRSPITGLNDLLIEQFTGLRDKNGREIYEGDIVRLCRAMKYSGNRGDIGSVDFDPSELGYLIMNVYARSRLTESRAKYMEIIGKIHENPEFLK